jgi:hypothetical protein
MLRSYFLPYVVALAALAAVNCVDASHVCGGLTLPSRQRSTLTWQTGNSGVTTNDRQLHGVNVVDQQLSFNLRDASNHALFDDSSTCTPPVNLTVAVSPPLPAFVALVAGADAWTKVLRFTPTGNYSAARGAGTPSVAAWYRRSPHTLRVTLRSNTTNAVQGDELSFNFSESS